MQDNVGSKRNHSERLLMIVLSVGGVALEYATWIGRSFSERQLHERRTIIGTVVAGLIIAAYA